MNLEIGKQYDVTVTRILPVGAVVELEDKSTELVHISNIADAFVKDVSYFVSVGHTYSALCQEGKVKPVELTFRHLGLKSQENEVR